MSIELVGNNRGMKISLILVLLCVFSALSCTRNDEKVLDSSKVAERDFSGDPHVVVQSILIAFKGSLPGKEISRSQKEAKKLALEVFEKAKENPKSFEELVKAESDDQIPGIYKLANYGQELQSEEFHRSFMVKSFGDRAFGLEKGEVGFVEYDSDHSPYGFHVLLRVK